MSSSRIAAQPERCVGAGQCVLAAPGHFDQDDDGLVIVLDDAPQDDQLPLVRNAVSLCPAQVITLDHG